MVSIHGVGYARPRRKQRSVKSLTRIDPAAVTFKLDGLSTQQIAAILRRLEAIQGISVPPVVNDRMSVIIRDLSSYERIYRTVEHIIEDVT